jgi:hypothetical protein
VHPRRLAPAVRTRHHQLAGTGSDTDHAARHPHSFHPHRIEVLRHNSYEVITLADGLATRDGASSAHGGTSPLHGNLARATFTCTPTTPATSGRTGFQHLFQATQLTRIKPAAGATGTLGDQGLPTARSQRPMPAVRRHPSHSESPGHLCVAGPSVDQGSGDEPDLLAPRPLRPSVHRHRDTSFLRHSAAHTNRHAAT